MAKEICHSDRFILTQFWNGEELALEIEKNATESSNRGNFNVTKDNALELIDKLTDWVKGV